MRYSYDKIQPVSADDPGHLGFTSTLINNRNKRTNLVTRCVVLILRGNTANYKAYLNSYI